MTVKIAVLGSGSGSNFEAIVKHFQNHPNIEITCFSDNPDSGILQRAGYLDIKGVHLPYEDTFKYFSQTPYDLYVLAGYMRILPEQVINLGTFINIHPSLLPAFKGKNAIKQAYDFGAKVCGVTVHYASKEVDSGEIIEQIPVKIEANMSLEELEEKIHFVEHKIYPMVIESLLYEKILKGQTPPKSNGCGGGCGGCGGCGS